MPMEQVITLNNCKKINVIRKFRKTDFYAPNKQSLAFILQFAAVYHIEKDLSFDSLSGIILN